MAIYFTKTAFCFVKHNIFFVKHIFHYSYTYIFFLPFDKFLSLKNK